MPWIGHSRATCSCPITRLWSSHASITNHFWSDQATTGSPRRWGCLLTVSPWLLQARIQRKKNMRTIINGLISKAYLFVGVEKISWIVTGLCAKYSGWVLAVPYWRGQLVGLKGDEKEHKSREREKTKHCGVFHLPSLYPLIHLRCLCRSIESSSPFINKLEIPLWLRPHRMLNHSKMAWPGMDRT